MTTSTAHGTQAAPSPVSTARRSPVLAVLRYAAYDLRRNLRMVESLFFVIVLPSALYLMFGALTEFGDFPAGSGNVAGTIAVSMAVYGATVATTSIAGTAAVERSKGWGRLLGLTPMRQAEYAAAKVLVALAIAALPVIVVFIVAALTGADIGPIGTWLATGLITVAASAVFALYGLTFGLLFRSESAVGAASGLLVVLAFFGNLFMPLSGTLLEIARFTPIYGIAALTRWPQLEGTVVSMEGGAPAGDPLWAVVLAFGFSAGVGLIFGMFPAIKASRLDPIVALRHE